MMKHTIQVRVRGMKESIVEIKLHPETEKDKQLIEGAKKAELNEHDYEYFNNLLVSICLNNNFTPIASAGEEGNTFFFRVMS
ncbi:hypothetical protein [Flavisolibacter nicotianae]|uniref:hypothetical protein n=1 Tax=Flavisolibacter nicotianae TaxID=2364882 RepID=UPI000EAD1DBD|nr:hypothetical protein [Flavisolibacter nicotianae]